MKRNITPAEAKEYTLKALAGAGIAITAAEKERIEIADMGLGRLAEFGLEIITYVNTSRCCAKELVLMPDQICPEHRHPAVEGEPGKEETFRCRRGEVFLYVEGTPTPGIRGSIPSDRAAFFTVFHEVVLGPG